MRSDPIYAIKGLNDRVRDLRDKSLRLKTLQDRLKNDLDARQAEVESLSVRIEKLTKVGELFRTLMDLLVVKQVRSVENIVTEGFHSIFHDLDLSFESDIGPKFNKVSVDFYLRQGSKDDPLSHRGRPLEAFGGGPTSVADLILRVLTVMRLGRWPLFILDEALGAVSDEYVDQTGQFLRDLAQKMKTDVLLVTHKPAFSDQAAVAYRCSEVVEGDGRRHLTLRDLRRGGSS